MFLDDINSLAEITMTDKDVYKFFKDELYDPELEKQPKAVEKQLTALINLYNNGAGAEMGKGTAWGALNAVTNLFTHGNSTRKDPSKIFWDGYITNDKIKQTAMRDLLELA